MHKLLPSAASHVGNSDHPSTSQSRVNVVSESHQLAFHQSASKPHRCRIPVIVPSRVFDELSRCS
jgi:hypothetical protein